MAKTMFTFHYHRQGSDSNGNFGPLTIDFGWITVQGMGDGENEYQKLCSAAQDALSKLPPTARSAIESKVHSDGYNNVIDWLASTCGWGANFSFVTHDDWNAMKDSE